MARLHHPTTGQSVDVPDHDRTLLEYYRGEGYLETGNQSPAETLTVTEVQPAVEPEQSASLDLDEDEHDDDTSSQTDA